jgi:hypothetical protein
LAGVFDLEGAFLSSFLAFDGAAFSFLVSFGADLGFSCSGAGLFFPANFISPSFSYFSFLPPFF